MRTAWLPSLGLFVLAPVCAEYVWGYDDSTGHWGELVGNLFLFAPLYGAPALLIREAARRFNLGWPGILLLAGAFGVIQAGIADQSMWSTDYRDIPYWQDMAAPSYLAPIGLSIYLAVSFVGGHVIMSIGAPTAVIETLTPTRRHSPWLGPITLVVLVGIYLAASAAVVKDGIDTGNADATTGQLVGSAVTAIALVVAAFVVGRRPALVVPGAVPSPLTVGAGAFVGMLAFTQIPPSRIGTALVCLVGIAAIVIVWRLSHRGDWGQLHVLALACGALLAAAGAAFFTDPIGHVSDQQKYVHNVMLLLLVAALTGWAARRSRRGWT